MSSRSSDLAVGQELPHEVADPGTFGTRATAWASRFYPLDAFLFGLFIFDRVAVGPLPLGVGMMVFIALVAIFRRPKLRLPHFGLFVAFYLSLVGFAVAVSQASGLDWHQRALRWVLLLLIIWALVGGRFDAYSALIGIITALAINVAAYYLGLTSDNYPPFLTGFLGDKNVAGLWYAIFGALGLALWRTGFRRLLWIVAVMALLLLTGSRTSMSGFSVACAWWFLRNKLILPLRWLFIGGAIALLGFAEENLARIGMFSDRGNTDWYRDQVEAAVSLKVAQTPWTGLGLSEAWTWVSAERREWFHDSYAALYVEGGVVLLVGMIIIYAVIAGGALDAKVVSRKTLAAEAAIFALMVCAWKLGEVFFTTGGFLILSFALRARYSQPIAEPARSLVGRSGG